MKQTFLKSRGHRYMEYIDKVRLNNLKIKTSSALIAPPPTSLWKPMIIQDVSLQRLCWGYMSWKVQTSYEDFFDCIKLLPMFRIDLQDQRYSPILMYTVFTFNYV